MELDKENIKKILSIIVFCFFLLLCTMYIKTILAVLGYIISLLSPLIIGGCIAFVLNILLQVLEQLWDKIIKNNKSKVYKFKRPVTVLFTYAIIFFTLYLVMFLIVPEISRSFAKIAQSLPEFFEGLRDNNLVIDISSNLNIDLNDLPASNIDWNKLSEQATKFLSSSGSTFFNTTLNITTSIFGVISTLGLSLVFSVYMLLQKEKLSDQFTRLVYAFFNREYVSHIINVGRLSSTVFSNFVKGQLIEAIIIGVMCYIGMIVLGMPYATMVSTLVGFTALIPVVGAFLGTGIGALLILLVNPIQALWFVIYIIIIQQIDGNFIYPRVVGKSVGLPSLWVLAAVVIGGSANGILGMLLGVPIFSILYSILKSIVDGRLAKNPIEDRVKDEQME